MLFSSAKTKNTIAMIQLKAGIIALLIVVLAPAFINSPYRIATGTVLSKTWHNEVITGGGRGKTYLPEHWELKIAAAGVTDTVSVQKTRLAVGDKVEVAYKRDETNTLHITDL